ncbi:hypothetical protein L2E82_15334 [Cichorium intybus]|uniref:Uncharacterized protein n=1 Tax=Cichorium intybus TaxID=13427 RepID=A0ACB9F2J0_CICIN|nr:hypothetical protein L2E82_15334 [Cichorium intybus]
MTGMRCVIRGLHNASKYVTEMGRSGDQHDAKVKFSAMRATRSHVPFHLEFPYKTENVVLLDGRRYPPFRSNP